MMRTLFMAALLAFLSIQTATGAEIQKVRVFAGDEHARIIVLNSDTITGLETRSSPATSTARPFSHESQSEKLASNRYRLFRLVTDCSSRSSLMMHVA